MSDDWPTHIKEDREELPDDCLRNVLRLGRHSHRLRTNVHREDLGCPNPYCGSPCWFVLQVALADVPLTPLAGTLTKKAKRNNRKTIEIATEWDFAPPGSVGVCVSTEATTTMHTPIPMAPTMNRNCINQSVAEYAVITTTQAHLATESICCPSSVQGEEDLADLG